MPLPANVTSVYIAGGAFVSGGFITSDSKSAVKISGRGVLSGSAQTFLKDPAGWGPCSYNGSYCWSLVNLDKGANHADVKVPDDFDDESEDGVTKGPLVKFGEDHSPRS